MPRCVREQIFLEDEWLISKPVLRLCTSVICRKYYTRSPIHPEIALVVIVLEER